MHSHSNDREIRVFLSSTFRDMQFERDYLIKNIFPVRKNYSSIEALIEKIKADLFAVLDARYPADQIPSPLQAERNTHEAYAKNRRQAYIDNPADILTLDGYLQLQISDKDVEVLPVPEDVALAILETDDEN